MLKTGRQHIDTLNDGREVFINGGKVDDVTTHPAFRNMVATVGELYDYQSRSENVDLMTFEIPAAHGGKGGERANRIWQLPNSYDELASSAESFSNDSTVQLNLSAQIADYVDAGGEVRFRVGWRKTGFTLNFPWQVMVDHVFWDSQN